jgi:hypothetical protein
MWSIYLLKKVFESKCKVDERISEESVLRGLWGEEARRDMLEYVERINKKTEDKITVADLNWFRSAKSLTDKTK